MDKDLEDYFRVYSDLFLTDGWKQFIEELKVSYENTNRVDLCSTNTDFPFLLGQLDTLATVIAFEESTQRQKEELENPEELTNPLEH